MSMPQVLKNIALASAVMLLAACAGASQKSVSRYPQAERGSNASSVGQTIASAALSQLGRPYRYGGQSPAGFDCSGLVVFAYRAARLNLPRSSADQYRLAEPVEISRATPGDLLFFRYSGRVSHVGIYLGEARFVHAPSSGGEVSVRSLKDPHYRQRLVSVGRFTAAR